MRSSSVAVLLALLSLWSCSGGGSSAPPAGVTLVSINVTPASPSIAVGASVQFSATGSYSDSSTQDLTAAATWSSSAAGIAAVSDAPGSKGSANGIAAGTTVISAASGGKTGTATLTVTGGAALAANEMTVTVNGSLCAAGSYLNKPCVTVTICTPGTATCQTITDILLDTGSFGLRVFKQALTVNLAATASGSGSLAECVQFGDGSSLWGPVKTADVVLGGESGVQVPIQVVDATFGSLPAGCQNADASPSTAGFTGILGLGLFAQDCGPACAANAANGMYYSCSGTACTGAVVALASQVQNPVALLAQDSNGVIVQLPAVPLGGSPSTEGKLILGIGTQSNNVPGSVTAFGADGFGEIKTLFNGNTYKSIIDSGSNGLFFPSPATLPTCASPYTSWFCPASTASFSATNTGAPGTPSSAVFFQIENFANLSGANSVFAGIGGPSPSLFDWGLPFYLGRTVYVGIEGTTSSLGTGPYVAY
ncbi:MAG: DUF3443 family protein [Nitrospiraceae bacterium]|nr:DUF3443 family protein [Nitrospiraceae bacterium]